MRNRPGRCRKGVWRSRHQQCGTADTRSAQLVFCDLSVPTGGQGFSVYEDMRNKLLARGVPTAEVQFIQDHDGDAAKLQLFRDVRAGKVRILFGSTQKMGTGANVQERLIARATEVDIECHEDEFGYWQKQRKR